MIIASRQETREWAYEEFGHAQLGDTRRTLRLVRMAAEAARHPGGTVLDVFRTHAERQGAYDFLANSHIRESDILKAMAVATASRCKGQPFVFVVVATLKTELTDAMNYPTRNAAMASITDYLETLRRHSHLGHPSPVEFELRTQVRAFAA